MFGNSSRVRQSDQVRRLQMPLVRMLAQQQLSLADMEEVIEAIRRLERMADSFDEEDRHLWGQSAGQAADAP